jgi:hypothetical protein
MPAALQVGYFPEQRNRIDDQSIANHAELARMERAGGDQSQNEFFSADDQRVRCVVSALEADDDVSVSGEHIDNLALALVSPLRADHGHCLHFSPLERTSISRAHSSAPVAAEAWVAQVSN